MLNEQKTIEKLLKLSHPNLYSLKGFKIYPINENFFEIINFYPFNDQGDLKELISKDLKMDLSGMRVMV